MMGAGSPGDRIACSRCGANNFTGKANCWQCAAPLSGAQGGARPSAPGVAHTPTTSPANAAQAPVHQAGSAPQPPWIGASQPQQPHSWAGNQPTPQQPWIGGQRAAQQQPWVGGQQGPQPPAGSRMSPREAARSAAFVQKWGMSPGVAALVAAVGLGMFLVVWVAAGRLRSGEEVARPAPQAPASAAAPGSNETEAARSVIGEDDPLVAESKRFIDHESRHAGLDQTPVSSDGRVHLRGGGSITPEQYRDAQRRVNDSPVIRAPIPAPPMP